MACCPSCRNRHAVSRIRVARWLSRSLVIEITGIFAFVTPAFLTLDSPAWTAAVVHAARGLWDLAQLNGRVTSHVGDYPVWCATLDVTAAAVLLVSTAF